MVFTFQKSISFFVRLKSKTNYIVSDESKKGTSYATVCCEKIR